jgi:hypothetical protein
MALRPEYAVDFPTLWIGPDWIEAHCVVPDGFRRGAPMELYDWQLWSTVNHYRVKPTAKWRPEAPVLGPAFHNRRSQVVAPQKTGKGPWSASVCALEGAGPALFAGWAEGGEIYYCSEHGCPCGWSYEYRPGEPMGMRWPTPLIQITAFAEAQTDNIFRPLQAMIRYGPLADLMKVGEEFIRIGDEGRIDVVTSSALARLGNPITFAMQDETGIWTVANKMDRVAVTQRRGAAGMGGRTMETTNMWNPAEDSVAQRTHYSAATDVFRFLRRKPANLSYKNKAERRKIHKFVYAGSLHVDLDSIEAEAAEILEKEPENAERFFGNGEVYGQGAWLDGDKWDFREDRMAVPKGTPIVFAFDGSDVDDWTAIRAQTEDGYQFTPVFGPDRLPMIWNPADHGGQVPRTDVDAAVEHLFAWFRVVRGYFDPPDWKTEIDGWAKKFGDKRVIRWETYRPVQMHAAAVRLHADVTKQDTTFSHDGCSVTAQHVRNARKLPRPPNRYVLGKPAQHQKIDACVTSILCNEAAGDVTAAKLWPAKSRAKLVVMRR